MGVEDRLWPGQEYLIDTRNWEAAQYLKDALQGAHVIYCGIHDNDAHPPARYQFMLTEEYRHRRGSEMRIFDVRINEVKTMVEIFKPVSRAQMDDAERRLQQIAAALDTGEQIDV